MKILRRIRFGALGLSLFSLSFQSFGYGVGVSTHPIQTGRSVLSTEFVGLMSNGKGMGIQVKYLNKVSSTLAYGMGAGFSDSSRTNRVFGSVDMEFFSDYGQRPRIGMKGILENAEEFGTRRNIVGVAPTISKGFSFWGHQGFPFLALPMQLMLDSTAKSYNLRTDVTLGITGELTDRMVYNLEGNMNVAGGFSAFFAGLSFPLE